MPPKAKLAMPIDRPLSRAYLREFSGWSTAFPPGLSEPTSLRIMENVLVNRDGSLRVRPGLRYLSYDGGLALHPDLKMVGSHEVFLLNDGTKAYLFAVRELSGLITFRVAKDNASTSEPLEVMTLLEAGFPSEPTPLEADTTYVRYLQIDNKIFVLSNAGDTLRVFHAGAVKKTISPQVIPRPNELAADRPLVRHPSPASIGDPVAFPALTNPAGRVLTYGLDAGTLRPPPDNDHNAPYTLGYYYTFSNELGETAPSQWTQVKVQRRWTAWDWDLPKASGEPSWSETEAVYGEDGNNDPAKAADQLIIYPTEAAFDAAKAAGATEYSVYAIAWSDQDPVPVEGLLVGRKEMDATTTYLQCWVRHSAAGFDGTRALPLPDPYNRRNYSDPSRAGQGLIVGDRMVLVYDPVEAAVIKWTANQVGDYSDFTASRGGGYKTLTSGNLQVPACVKLWQNPESKDTITILCLGMDGYSTAYYMAASSVTSQTDSTQIMSFEETTATAGTVAPYANEVLNNALYHPLESDLVKSTASNYNINHKTMTDNIVNQWRKLTDKINMVSSQHDNRLYYIVHNPDGEELEDGCRGNEVWVLDTATKEAGSWSRWLVQAHSLRKIEIGGKVHMSLTRPDGIFCFDEEKSTDDVVSYPARTVAAAPIPWKIETNTQGANRAHDAWAHLKQLSVTLGSFLGTMRYGVKGFDVHGKTVDVSKVVKDSGSASTDGLPWDLEDYLQVRRDMKEWRFYASSEGALPSSGQINLVQYRYTPVSVNVGYEYGSVETFEYGTAAAGTGTYTTNGTPVPMIDTRRP